MKEKIKDSDFAIGFGILVIVIVGGILGLKVLQNLSISNKHICSYLGGLWVKKDSDKVHRCYTYEEVYK